VTFLLVAAGAAVGAPLRYLTAHFLDGGRLWSSQWEIPAGQMTIRYTCVVKDGAWREVGDRIMPGAGPLL
jgi:hypothetical protein